MTSQEGGPTFTVTLYDKPGRRRRSGMRHDKFGRSNFVQPIDTHQAHPIWQPLNLAVSRGARCKPWYMVVVTVVRL